MPTGEMGVPTGEVGTVVVGVATVVAVGVPVGVPVAVAVPDGVALAVATGTPVVAIGVGTTWEKAKGFSTTRMGMTMEPLLAATRRTRTLPASRFPESVNGSSF